MTTTTKLGKDLLNLPVETFALAVDEDGNEYTVEGTIEKISLHVDNNSIWNYAIKIKKTGNGTIKR